MEVVSDGPRTSQTSDLDEEYTDVGMGVFDQAL